MAETRRTFIQFSREVLGLKLTLGQRTLAKVAFDGVEPGALRGEEREVARIIFGEDVDVVPALARRILLLVLGRESGKTLLSAAFAVYTMVTATVPARQLDLPCFVIIAPTRKTAELAQGMAGRLVRGSKLLAKMVESETGEGFVLKRPDGATVKLAVYAASRGGATVRGIPLLGFILDESWFFQSDGDGAVVNDRDNYRALRPRLMKGAKGVFLTTPWPVPTLTGEIFERNFGDPTTALACRAPTLIMRDNDPEIAERVAEERAEDAENTARERDADTEAVAGSGEFFDMSAVMARVDESLSLPANLPSGHAAALGGDLAFSRDSSAVCVVSAKSDRFVVLAVEEWKPKPKQPLKPSVVIANIAEIGKRYGVKSFAADGHYKATVSEFLEKEKIQHVPTPEGMPGKFEMYSHARKLIEEGRVSLPNHPRLLNQLRGIIAKKVDGGKTKITSPRRSGGGHGDLCSALVAALWQAKSANSQDGWSKRVTNLPHDRDGQIYQGTWFTDDSKAGI